MANVRSKNEERLLQRDNLSYYGTTIIPSQQSLQVRTPPDGCESDTLSRDRNKNKRPLDPAPERTFIPDIREEEEVIFEQGCKVNSENCCLALSCVVDCCPLKFRQQRRISQRSKIRRIRTEGWKLLWSILVPLALKPLNLVWLATQLIMALVLLVITALDRRDSALDASSLAISGAWTALTLIDSAVLIFSSSSIRRILVQWFRPCKIPEENQLTNDNESPSKYYIQGYAPVVRFLYSWFCLLPLLWVEAFSTAQTVTDGAMLGLSSSGPVNLTEYQLSGNRSVNVTEYGFEWRVDNVTSGLGIARLVIFGTSLLVFVEIALVVMVACVLYKSKKFHHLVQHDPKWNSVPFFKMVFLISVANGCLFQVFVLIIMFPQIGLESAVCKDRSNQRGCIYAHTLITGSFAVVLAPLMSTIMFLFANHFWFQEFLIGLYLDVMYIRLENRRAEAGLPSCICRRLHYSSQNDFDVLVQGFVQLQNNSVLHKIVYPFQSPAAIIFGFILLLTCSAYMIVYPVIVTLSLNFYLVASFWYAVTNMHVLLFAELFVVVLLMFIMILIMFVIILLTLLCSLPLLFWLCSKYGHRIRDYCDSVP